MSLLRSLSFSRRKPKKIQLNSSLNVLNDLEKRNTQTDDSKLLEAHNLAEVIKQLEMESQLPSPPNRLQDEINQLSLQANELEKTLKEKREELSKLKLESIYPSVPGDVTQQTIDKLKGNIELLSAPEKMRRLHNIKSQLHRKITEAKMKSLDNVKNSKKIRLAKMKQDLNLLLQDDKIKDMFQKKMLQERLEQDLEEHLQQQTQEERDAKEAEQLLQEYGFKGGKRRKKRKTKKNKKNKTKRAKKEKKAKKYTRK